MTLRYRVLCAIAATYGASSAAAQSQAGRGAAASRVVATLPDSTFWPEGIDQDPRTGRLYVSSVRHGIIVEISPDGSRRELPVRDASRRGAIFAVRVDTARGVLWATYTGVPQMLGYHPTDSAIAALVRIRLSDGVVERRWDLRYALNGHVLGDLAVSATGDVFVSDSYHPVVYRLRAGADTLEQVRSLLFTSPQGVTTTPDGRVLYVADYSRGLMRVDLATNVVARLQAAASINTRGVDGLLYDHGALIGIQNGVAPARVVRFVLDASGTRIERADVIDQNTVIADEPTNGVIVGRELVYVANSQWEKYDVRGVRIPGKVLVPPVLLAVPLP